ncbi:MAG: M14 family zinc carboxypeptidase [Anaerolineae bacterium]
MARSPGFRLLLALVLCSLLLPVAHAAPVVPPHSDGFTNPIVARVYYDDAAQIKQLADFDLFEYNNTTEKYVLVAVDQDEYAAIERLGFRLQVDELETANFNRKPEISPDQVNGIPGYPCYRTVEETFATAQSIVTNYPQLASFVDAGNSWQKSAGLGGYDMNVLVLTNSAVPGPKPKLFITSAIHAREYTTAELATRFAEYLVTNYNVDPDVTWILDYHEVHLMLHTNPDGRKQAETGLSWRKNTNQNYCGATSTSRGADLNRNFNFQWGCCGGSSSSQCSETYRGPSAASEPETQAAQAYMRAIFPDQRGPLLTDPAPPDATGVYVDIHSYSQLVLWPWGFTSTVAPNGPALQTLGRKFAYFNSYLPEQAIGLYATDGTTDDFSYGDLGIASYTFELGTSFFQDCSTFENTILPTNMPALIYAAKASRTPYMTAAGPDALGVAAAPVTVTTGDPVNLSATLNDTRFNNSNGSEPTQAVAAAEYYIDTPPWQAGAVAYPMSPADGTFNSTIENAVATINTSGLNSGRHTIFVRGKDAANNWGAVSAVFLTLSVFSATPVSQAICTPANADYTINVGYAGAVTFSAIGHPLGATATFTPNPVAGPGSTTLTIGNTGSAATGNYTISVTGLYNGGSQTSNVLLNVANAAPGTPTLVSPANNAANVAALPTFTWTAVAQAAAYSIQIALDGGFTNIVASASGLTGVSYTPSVTLATSTRYYWRVWADNACGVSAYSTIFTFTTVAAPGDCGPGLVPSTLLSEDFETGPNGWTLGSGGSGNTWALWGTRVHSGLQAFHATDPATSSDQRLVSPSIALPSGQNPLSLQFWNYQSFEPRSGGCYDGGILEISTNAGSTWTQITSGLLTDPYNGPIGSGNPLGTVNAWCGDPQDWLNSIVDLNPYAGQTVKFRFRLGSDTSVGRPDGWNLDDVVVRSCQVETACYWADPDCSCPEGGATGIDVVDIAFTANAWSLYQTTGAYTRAADVDCRASGGCDQVNDIRDVQAVASMWGTACPE